MKAKTKPSPHWGRRWMHRPANPVALLLAAACLTAFALPGPASAAPRKKRPPKSALPREPGAIYLDDFIDKPVKLTVKGEPPIYKSTLRKDALGILIKNREVELVAMTDKQYRVRGQAHHGTVVGWVLPSDLNSLDKSFVDDLKNLYERQIKVDELIENNEIALGMTVDEIAESIGRPSRKSSKLNKGGREDVYEYISYKRVPQYRYVRDQDGRLYQETYYIKIESGKLTVTFKNQIAESIEESEGDPGGGNIRIVPAPIILR